MAIKTVSSPDPKYLSSTDILIGDMSDINYEFLLLDKPLILLANEWIHNNWPDIGVKTNINGLNDAIIESNNNPNKYSSSRKIWLNKTIYQPYENASLRILDKVIKLSKFRNPILVIVDGNSEVRRSNLISLYNEALSRNMKVIYQNFPKKINISNEVIYLAVHFEDLIIKSGFNVHLDHGLKGKGAANVQLSIEDYKKNNYFPLIDLHITAGSVGDERTKMQLGPNHHRTWIGGYPKADTINFSNTKTNRNIVCTELGFNPEFPIITYASTGPLSDEKPGGSLNPNVLAELKRISEYNNYNVLIKLKNSKKSFFKKLNGFVLKKINKLYIKFP